MGVSMRAGRIVLATLSAAACMLSVAACMPRLSSDSAPYLLSVDDREPASYLLSVDDLPGTGWRLLSDSPGQVGGDTASVRRFTNGIMGLSGNPFLIELAVLAADGSRTRELPQGLPLARAPWRSKRRP